MQKMSKAGNIYQEMNEIKHMQEKVRTYWTMATNTCTGFMTWFCC